MSAFLYAFAFACFLLAFATDGALGATEHDLAYLGLAAVALAFLLGSVPVRVPQLPRDTS